MKLGRGFCLLMLRLMRIRPALQDIVWVWQGELQEKSQQHSNHSQKILLFLHFMLCKNFRIMFNV